MFALLMQQMSHISDKPSQEVYHTHTWPWHQPCAGKLGPKINLSGHTEPVTANWKAAGMVPAGPQAWFECQPCRLVAVSCTWKNTEAALDLVRNSVTINMWHLSWAWGAALSETAGRWLQSCSWVWILPPPLPSCVTLSCCLTSGHPLL